jgi:coenzyme F420-reducing hydrogenase gamma subunit
MAKLKVGIFSFTCDEGCTVHLLEVLNDKFFEWKNCIDFQHFRLLQSKSNKKKLDVAVVEGAISSKKEEKEVKRIRKNTKRLVLLGNCAITGEPSNQRNLFDKNTMKEIQPILEKFDYRKRVAAVKELVKADESVPGCPMQEVKFVEVMEKYVKEFCGKKRGGK